MFKFNRAAGNQSVSTPDNAVLTLPDGDWAIGFKQRYDGLITGDNPQYVISTGAFQAAGSLNIVFQTTGVGESTQQGRLVIFAHTGAPAAAVSNSVVTTGVHEHVIQRSGGTVSIYRCEITGTVATAASVITDSTSTSTSLIRELNGSGFKIGSRLDDTYTRKSDQSISDVFLLKGTLTLAEIARLANGEKLSAIGKTPALDIGMSDTSDIIDRSPNNLPFTVAGSPTTSAEPTYPVVTPEPSNTVSLSVTAERVYQRSNGSAAVDASCTYSGVEPTSIERQLYAADGVTVTHAWAAIPGATFTGGNVLLSQGIVLPEGLKRRIAVRTKSGSNVLATSSVSARVGVGALDAYIGSSSAEKLFDSTSGTGFTADANGSKFNETGWSLLGTAGAGILISNSLIAQSGLCRGALDYGIGGTTLVQWLDKNGPQWTAFAAGVAAAGGKLEVVDIAIGSNDAATANTVLSRVAHAANIRALIQNVRTLTGQPNLPVILSGFNRRSGGLQSGQTTAAFNIAADQVRMAENDVGTDPLVTHVATLEFAMHTDNVHLTPNAAGFPASATRAALIFGRRQYGDGVYLRGPRITALTFDGADLLVDVTHGTGTDLSPATGGTGFTVTDASGTPALVSTARVSATRYRATFGRPLVAPVFARYQSGGAPDVSAAIFDNGTVPLPMLVETEMATVAASTEEPALDTTAPVMTGSISISNVTTAGATISWPTATDGVGVVGYQYSINGGTAYIDVGAARTVTVSGRPASTAHQVRVRAYDAAGNRATPLAASFTTLAAQPAQNAVVASAVAESRRVAFPGGTRVVAFGSVPSAVTPNAPYLEAGKWWSEKHPLDERYWVADLTIDLDERGTTAKEVEVLEAGVAVLEQAVIQGKLIPVKLGGFNPVPGAVNSCTFRVTCANGERFDRTIWFKQPVGAWWIDKDADDQSYFVADIGNDLIDSGTTATAVKAFPVGVVELVPAVLQGPLILVKLGGMDTLPAGVNYCDFRIDCANGERFYRSMQFNRVDN
jgi:hypothetical protein